MSQRILVVEDNPSEAEFIVAGLRQEGHAVELAAAGPDALYLATRERFDAIVLDRNLPQLDGLSVLKSLRAANIDTPVIILSALAHADERVNGLRSGADDYLAKPFTLSELIIRLEILGRRRGGQPAEAVLRCGGLELDLLARRAKRDEKPINLLPKEFQILEYLMQNQDRVVTRAALLEHIWDYRFDPHTSLIDTHVSRLRKKLDEGFEKSLLHTIRNVGYRLSETP
jgi:two-component system OmpR family response regulator